MSIGLSHYLTVAAILFTIGVFGIFVNRKNVIIILMCIELILLSVNINFVAFSFVVFLGLKPLNVNLASSPLTNARIEFRGTILYCAL